MQQITNSSFYRACLKQAKAMGNDSPYFRKQLREGLVTQWGRDSAYLNRLVEVNRERQYLLSGAFIWVNTPQGREYWLELSRLLGDPQ